jgi:nitrate reductase alpha subunit
VENTKKKAPDTDSGETKTRGAAQAAIGENFLTVYRQYVDALRETHERVQQRYCDAQADLARAVVELQFNSHRAREDAFRAYVARMQDARGDDAYRLAGEAEHLYLKDLEAAQSRERKGLEEANSAAAAVVQETNEQASKERHAARLAHSKGVQDGFAKADPHALVPDVMALIGQSLVAASNYASPTQHH